MARVYRQRQQLWLEANTAHPPHLAVGWLFPAVPQPDLLDTGSHEAIWHSVHFSVARPQPRVAQTNRPPFLADLTVQRPQFAGAG